MGANDDLSDELIARSIRASRAGNGIWRELLPLLRRAEREIVARIAEIGPTRTFQSTRAEAMLRAIRRIIDDGAENFFQRLEGDGAKLAGIEGVAAARVFAETIPFEYNWVTPATRLLKAIASERPFDGAILKDHLSNWSSETIFAMQGEIRTALLQGQTIEQIQRRIRRVADIKIDQARTLARSYVSHVVNAAHAETYAANAEVIAGEVWVTTLDDRTCLRCGPLDNKRFPIGKGPRPPLHMNCRCIRAPIVRGVDDLIERGILPEGTRSSADGQVPQSLRFEDWLRRQSDERQRSVLGVERLRRWRAGTPLDRFTNDEFQIIPLDDL